MTRTVTPSVPVRVDYALTPPGASLATLFSAVKEWAEEHIEEVVEARERDDTEAGAGGQPGRRPGRSGPEPAPGPGFTDPLCRSSVFRHSVEP